MRRKSRTTDLSSEEVVKDIRRSTRNDLDVIKANFHMTEQRIGLGEPPELMREMIRQMLEQR